MMALLLNANDSVSRSYSITKPSPLHPIMPIGCGERTENLVFTGWAEDFVRRVASAAIAYITQVDGRTCLCAWAHAGYDEYDTKYIFKTDFKESTVYTLSFEYMRPSDFSAASTIRVKYTDGTSVQTTPYINDSNWHKYTYVTASGKTVKSICCYYSSGYVYIDVNTFMVVEGSTPPDTYIPYGYKLPILSNSTVTNIYLGEVETTRRIKKLVLTGEENINTDNYLRFIILVYDMKSSTGGRLMRSYCSHYECLYHNEPFDNDWNNVYYQNGISLFFHDRRFATIDGFKSYLAAQYAAGTPVTVWYVLAEPETAVVNEPLMKIGDYSDTVDSTQTSAQIPTAAGETTISWAGEGLAPSEFDSIQEWVDIPTYTRVNGEWVADNSN